MRDALSVNEKYQNGCFDRRSAESTLAHPATPTHDLCQVFSLASDEVSGGDKSNGVGAIAQGEEPFLFFLDVDNGAKKAGTLLNSGPHIYSRQ